LTFRSVIIFIERNVHFRVKFPALNKTVYLLKGRSYKQKKRAGKEVSGKEGMAPHCFGGRR